MCASVTQQGYIWNIFGCGYRDVGNRSLLKAPCDQTKTAIASLLLRPQTFKSLFVTSHCITDNSDTLGTFPFPQLLNTAYSQFRVLLGPLIISNILNTHTRTVMLKKSKIVKKEPSIVSACPVYATLTNVPVKPQRPSLAIKKVMDCRPYESSSCNQQLTGKQAAQSFQSY